MNASDPIPFFSARANDGFGDLFGPIQRVLDAHWYVLGSEVAAFEAAFARYCGTSGCVSVANGTDALELALRALGVGPGDRVVTAANAGFYSSTAVHAVGATPHYVDVEAGRLTLDPAALGAALAFSPKAIIVTHLYGQLADIRALRELAGDIPVIEDCAQAHGAQLGGKLAGSFGTIGCFSFYPTKNLGALGDGGAVVTHDPALADRLRQLRQYGWDAKYHVTLTGGRNSRLDELQAAVLREKLPQLDRLNASRRAIASRYNAAFAGLPLRLPPSMGPDYVAHLYVVRLAGRDALRAALKARGIATDVHYPIPDPAQSAYAGASGDWHLPVTVEACASAVSLPCHPGLEEAQIERIIEGVQAFFNDPGAPPC